MGGARSTACLVARKIKGRSKAGRLCGRQECCSPHQEASESETLNVGLCTTVDILSCSQKATREPGRVAFETNCRVDPGSARRFEIQRTRMRLVPASGWARVKLLFG